MRHYAEQINTYIGVPLFAPDYLYNWKRIRLLIRDIFLWMTDTHENVTMTLQDMQAMGVDVINTIIVIDKVKEM